MTVNWSPFVVDEITIVGSRCGPFAPALRLLERGEVDPVILVAKRYPLAKAVEAMEAAKQPGMLKVLLEP
jgi:threonine dehydrogenase-like Zn-dependent dehydrogenase